WLSRGMDRKAQRIPLGNLFFRLAGALLALVVVETATPPMAWLGGDAGMALVNLHVVFNAALVLVGLPLSGAMSSLTTKILPTPVEEGGSSVRARRVSALDRSVIALPNLALASVT